MRTLQAHFERIPVETVKKIAKDLPENKAVARDSVDVETQREVTATQEDWRQLAQRVQQESDPNRMITLVEQLIDTFDKEKASKSLPTRGNTHPFRTG